MGRYEGWLDGLRRRLLEMRSDPQRAAPIVPLPSRVGPQPPPQTQPRQHPPQPPPRSAQPPLKLGQHPNQLVDQGRSRLSEKAPQRVSDMQLIPDEAPVVVPGAASEKNQLEIETQRRRVLKGRARASSSSSAGIRKSLYAQHPIQSVADVTLEQLRSHVQPYVDSD
jgi:hypothetical protein